MDHEKELEESDEDDTADEDKPGHPIMAATESASRNHVEETTERNLYNFSTSGEVDHTILSLQDGLHFINHLQTNKVTEASQLSAEQIYNSTPVSNSHKQYLFNPKAGMSSSLSSNKVGCGSLASHSTTQEKLSVCDEKLTGVSTSSTPLDEVCDLSLKVDHMIFENSFSSGKSQSEDDCCSKHSCRNAQPVAVENESTNELSSKVYISKSCSSTSRSNSPHSCCRQSMNNPLYPDKQDSNRRKFNKWPYFRGNFPDNSYIGDKTCISNVHNLELFPKKRKLFVNDKTNEVCNFSQSNCFNNSNSPCDLNKKTLGQHNLNTDQSWTNRDLNEIIELRKRKLAEKALELQRTEELVKQKEREAYERTIEVLEQQEQLLVEKELSLKYREAVSIKKLEQINKLEEENKKMNDIKNYKDMKLSSKYIKPLTAYQQQELRRSEDAHCFNGFSCQKCLSSLKFCKHNHCSYETDSVPKLEPTKKLRTYSRAGRANLDSESSRISSPIHLSSDSESRNATPGSSLVCAKTVVNNGNTVTITSLPIKSEKNRTGVKETNQQYRKRFKLFTDEPFVFSKDTKFIPVKTKIDKADFHHLPNEPFSYKDLSGADSSIRYDIPFKDDSVWQSQFLESNYNKPLNLVSVCSKSGVDMQQSCPNEELPNGRNVNVSSRSKDDLKCISFVNASPMSSDDKSLVFNRNVSKNSLNLRVQPCEMANTVDSPNSFEGLHKLHTDINDSHTDVEKTVTPVNSSNNLDTVAEKLPINLHIPKMKSALFEKNVLYEPDTFSENTASNGSSNTLTVQSVSNSPSTYDNVLYTSPQIPQTEPLLGTQIHDNGNIIDNNGSNILTLLDNYQNTSNSFVNIDTENSVNNKLINSQSCSINGLDPPKNILIINQRSHEVTVLCNVSEEQKESFVLDSHRVCEVNDVGYSNENVVSCDIGDGQVGCSFVPSEFERQNQAVVVSQKCETPSQSCMELDAKKSLCDVNNSKEIQENLFDADKDESDSFDYGSKTNVIIEKSSRRKRKSQTVTPTSELKVKKRKSIFHKNNNKVKVRFINNDNVRKAIELFTVNNNRKIMNVSNQTDSPDRKINSMVKSAKKASADNKRISLPRKVNTANVGEFAANVCDEKSTKDGKVLDNVEIIVGSNLTEMSNSNMLQTTCIENSGLDHQSTLAQEETGHVGFSSTSASAGPINILICSASSFDGIENIAMHKINSSCNNDIENVVVHEIHPSNNDVESTVMQELISGSNNNIGNVAIQEINTSNNDIENTVMQAIQSSNDNVQNHALQELNSNDKNAIENVAINKVNSSNNNDTENIAIQKINQSNNRFISKVNPNFQIAEKSFDDLFKTIPDVSSIRRNINEPLDDNLNIDSDDDCVDLPVDDFSEQPQSPISMEEMADTSNKLVLFDEVNNSNNSSLNTADSYQTLANVDFPQTLAQVRSAMIPEVEESEGVSYLVNTVGMNYHKDESMKIIKNKDASNTNEIQEDYNNKDEDSQSYNSISTIINETNKILSTNESFDLNNVESSNLSENCVNPTNFEGLEEKKSMMNIPKENCCLISSKNDHKCGERPALDVYQQMNCDKCQNLSNQSSNCKYTEKLSLDHNKNIGDAAINTSDECIEPNSSWSSISKPEVFSDENSPVCVTKKGRKVKLKQWWNGVMLDESPKKQLNVKVTKHTLMYDDDLITEEISTSVEIDVTMNDKNPLRGTSTEEMITISKEETTVNGKPPGKKRGRKKKIESESESDSQEVDSETICGKCDMVFVNRARFKNHTYHKHNGVARPKGESQEFSENALQKVLKKTMKVVQCVRCEVCNLKYKSLLGYKLHRAKCGKPKIVEYKKCPICKLDIFDAQLKKHIKNAHSSESLVLNGSGEIKETTEININNKGRPKRKAASFCNEKISEWKSFKKSSRSFSDDDASTDNDDEKDINSLIEDLDLGKFYKKVTPKISYSLQNEWTATLLAGGKIECNAGHIRKSFATSKLAKKHYMRCSSHASYKCVLCNTVCQLEKDIAEHLTSKHERQIRVEDVEEFEERPARFLRPGQPKDHLQAVDFCLNWTLRFVEKNYSSLPLFEELFTIDLNEWKLMEGSKDEYLPKMKTSPGFQVNDIPVYKNDMAWEKMDLFNSHCDQNSCTVFAGGPVQSASWCPQPLKISLYSKYQYIALTALLNADLDYFTSKCFSHKGLIQIWEFPISNTIDDPPTFVCGIKHDFGNVWTLDWCPSGIYEETSTIGTPRLGTLAAGCSDGNIYLYTIPHPNSLTQKGVIYDKNPDIILSLCQGPDGQCVKISWFKGKNHKFIAGAFANGLVAIWDLSTTSPILSFKNGDSRTIYPFKCFSAHSGVCACVSFCHTTDGYHLVTGGNDRTYKFWDIRNVDHPLSTHRKGMVLDNYWSLHWAGAFHSFDNVYGLENTNTSYNENGFFGIPPHNVLSSNACVWSMSGSDWLNSVIQADDAGEVVLTIQFQLYKSYENYKCPAKRKLPIFCARLQDLTKCSTLSLKKNSKEEDEVEPDDDTNNEGKFESLPRSLEASKEKYGVVLINQPFHCFKELEEKEMVERRRSDTMEPGPVTMFPLHTSKVITWNNNLGSHCWVFVGLESGFGHFMNIKGLDQTMVKSFVKDVKKNLS